MTVKLAAKLPKDYTENGLDKGEAGFLAQPFDKVVIVAYVDVEKITTDYDKATKEPTVKLAAVEIIADDEQLAAVREAFRAAHDRRVNVAPKLPTEPDTVVIKAGAES